MEQRKTDHIQLAFSSRVADIYSDNRFSYEPLLGSYAQGEIKPFPFLGKTFRVPIWVSSMTGGSRFARHINANLARACREFGMGMGLGSCRILLEDKSCFDDFNVRDILGPDQPLYANIGIVQLEEMLEDNSVDRLSELVASLRADGLIIHVNPIQEWLQREGQILKHPAIDSIEQLLSLTEVKIIVKEVGQGMGAESIKRLLRLPLEAIELAAFGGTNFAKVELSRGTPQNQDRYEPLTYVGHHALDMVETINICVDSGEQVSCRQLIVSGGIRSFLDGYYFISKSKLPSIYGQASKLLHYAMDDYQDLESYLTDQVNGLKFARAFLRIRN
ncbi:MAG: type 2 isopentenyl-diphosphate Delta-isomerase [Bacteroidales bacterium]|nr:type 2 isopentenyl-diphosphate Delta-isomerase [Bacteroidales bacterium]